MLNQIYYVYIYLNPLKPGNYTYGNFVTFQFEPFYIGYGKKDRIFQHLQPKQIKNGKNRHLYNTILKILEETNKYPICTILKNNLSLDEAKSLEIFFIKLLGRVDLTLGPLTNLTNGGDGSSGMKHTKQWCKNHSNFMKGKPKTEEHKKNMRKPKPLGFGQKISIARKGIKFSNETKKKISKNSKLYFSNIKNRIKTSEATKIGMLKSNAGQKISLAKKGKPNPQTKEWIKKRILNRQKTVYRKKLLKILLQIKNEKIS